MKISFKLSFQMNVFYIISNHVTATSVEYWIMDERIEKRRRISILKQLLELSPR